MFFLRNIIIKIIQWQARVIIWRYKPKVIAVTGSVGKTGTKDAVYAVLSHFFHARKSKKSFNSGIGVPLTIIGCPTGWRDIIKWVRNLLKGFWVMLAPFKKYPKWLVLEIGIGKPGDMDELKQWVRPDIVVVSAFGEVPPHVEFFESKEEVWKEEASIIDALKSDGVLILNRDDERVYALRTQVKNRIVTFGFSDDADIHMQNDQIMYADNSPVGSMFRIEYEGKSLPVSFEGLTGKAIAYNSGAALAVAHAYGLNMIAAIEALKRVELPRGRGRLIKGVHGSVLIDDSYNSSPLALNAALNNLEAIQTQGRKIAVLGDMLELGKHSDEEHKKIGVRVAEFCDVLITVGVRARMFGTAAEETGLAPQNIKMFDDVHQATEFLKTLIREHDTLLVKGSQGIRMERIVYALMAHQEQASELLVRQEEEWLRKE